MNYSGAVNLSINEENCLKLSDTKHIVTISRIFLNISPLLNIASPGLYSSSLIGTIPCNPLPPPPPPPPPVEHYQIKSKSTNCSFAFARLSRASNRLLRTYKFYCSLLLTLSLLLRQLAT